MNFDFKSTFNKISKTTCDIWLVARGDHAFKIIFANTAAFALLAWLYLGNIIIPGTYTSGPFGNELVELFLLSAKLGVLSTGYSVLRLVNNYILASNVRLTRRATTRCVDAAREFCQAIAFGISVRVYSILKEPRQGYTHLLNPKTYISINLIV